jgi:exopolyphosphatase/guanosine-5'-triphosphate,3'-diphosphate pyrophosphatase
MIDTEIERAFSSVPAFGQVVGRVRLVGLAGSVATLAQLDAGLKTYDRTQVHHRLLNRACVERWRRTLAAETPGQRLEHPGMVRGREDVLTAGLYVLGAVMDRFRVTEFLTSENDILDGIVQSLLV